MPRDGFLNAGGDPDEDPVVVFVLVEFARRRNDFEKVVDGLRRLRQLGVDVRYLPPEAAVA